MSDYKVISADSHASEPMEIFERLPADMRHRAPRIDTIDGIRWLFIDGTRWGTVDAPHPLTEEDKRREERGRQDAGLVNPRENGVDIPLRLKDQDEDGISAEVVYPNGSFLAFASKNPDYQIAVARILNDYYADIFSAYPTRFVCSAVIPVSDIENAINESRRAVKLGYRSLSVPVTTQYTSYNWPEYGPFWDAVEEIRVPLSFHVFTGEGADQESA
ncbi:MAG: amidohydrolase family protein, partial [Dehalococcoidia bacterium]